MLIITVIIGVVELTQQNGCARMIASWRVGVKLLQVAQQFSIRIWSKNYREKDDCSEISVVIE
jgi:hypothetical protein